MQGLLKALVSTRLYLMAVLGNSPHLAAAIPPPNVCSALPPARMKV